MKFPEYPGARGWDNRVETRSYTAMCKLWRRMRDDEPPSYNDWAKQVAEGRVIISRQECDYEDTSGVCCTLLKGHEGVHWSLGDDIK